MRPNLLKVLFHSKSIFFILCLGFSLHVFAQPPNDNCSGALVLTSNTTCTNTPGTLVSATFTSPWLLGCGNNNSPDVWYQFVAKSVYPTITLSSVGTNIATNIRIQLLAGSCSSFTELGCKAGNVLPVFNYYPSGLTVGVTYYIRITTNSSTSSYSTNAGFNICVTDLAIDYSKSYVNISDGAVGGTINPGDVLEIRSTFVVTGGTITNLSFYDTLQFNGGLRYKDSIALRTNEGKNYKFFSDAISDDAGWFSTGGSLGVDTAIQINIGTGATATNGGTVTNISRPSFYGGTYIVMATYRVTVYGAYDSKINFGGGAFRFTTGGVNYTINFPPDSLRVYQTLGACSDAVSPGNLIGSATNGTFGGLPIGSVATNALQNGGPAAINTTYGYQTFAIGPQDYNYGIANNTSPTNSINQILGKPGGSARVFGVWDITGDHTGAANPAKGNPPCDISKPVSTTNPCGYMLAINAAYRSDKAFEYTATGVCSETYYEVSAWFKNLCYKCGCDSMGRGAGSGGYIPTVAPPFPGTSITSGGDSSGVRPNIAMQIDGIDYYTTGDILYQGLGGSDTGSDTLNNWVRRSFVFKTSPAQTSFKVTFRNNAPGGGGNDYAVDDIGLRTCYPIMIYAPPNPIVYIGSALTITDTVRSYFNSYTYYKWQTKPVAGSWTDVVPASFGNAVPVYNPLYNQFEYNISYTIPGTATLAANAGDAYRMVVASNALNLANGCNFVPSTSFTLLPTDAPCAKNDTNYAIAPQTESINWNKLSWSLGHVPTCCESAQITYNSSNLSNDSITVNITNDICIINLTLINKSTTANQLFKTILYPGYNMQMNGHVRMGAPAGTSTDSCIFIAKGGGTITVNGNTVIGYPADNAYCIFGSSPGTGSYAKYRLRGDSLTFNNKAITNPLFTAITIDPLLPSSPVKISNNTILANALTFDSLRIGTTGFPAKAILTGSTAIAYTNDNLGGIDVKEFSEFDMPINTINAGATLKSSFNLRANSLLKLGGSTNGVTGSNFPNFTSYNLDPTSTVQFYGGAQVIPGSGDNVNTFGNITLTGTGVKTGSISNINVAGNLYRTNGGHTYNANLGRVTFTSSINAQRYYADAGATPIDFYDFTNNNTHASGLSIDSTIGILDELELKTGTKTTLNTGDVIMRSSAGQTSHVSDLGSTIPAIIYNSTYRFVVERYLRGIKSWRFLASPVQLNAIDGNTPTISSSWRENVSALSATGYGTAITGPSGPNGELDYLTQRGSMKYYNDTLNVWKELSNTTGTKIANTQGYMVFVRGDRGVANSTTGSGTPTNLRIKGQIRTGDQLFNVLPNSKFQSIGNPFASQINFGTITKSFTTNSFIVWNPALSGLYSVGGYENYSIVGTDYKLNGVSTGAIRNTIESGEVIFVQNSTATAGTVTIKESDKGISSILLSRTANNGIVVPTIDITLFEKNTDSNFILVDGASTSFDNSFSSGLDNDDVIKFTNTNDNLFIKSNNKNLVVERRPTLTVNDTIKLGITGTKVAEYRFQINPYLLESTNLNAYLVDKYLQTETVLTLLDSNNINFNITTVAASKEANRFMIVFKTLPPIIFKTIIAERNEDKTATVKWEMEAETNANNYTVEQSNNGFNFVPIATQKALANNGLNITYSKIDFKATKAKNWYRIKATNRTGSIQYSTIVMVDEIIEPIISVYPNPVIAGKINLFFKYQPAGTYNIEISNKAGQILKIETIKVQNNSEMRIINLDSAVEGSYQIKITNNTGAKTTLSIMVK